MITAALRKCASSHGVSAAVVPSFLGSFRFWKQAAFREWSAEDYSDNRSNNNVIPALFCQLAKITAR